MATPQSPISITNSRKSSSIDDEKHYDPEKAEYGQGATTTVTELEALDDGVPRDKGFYAKLWRLAEKLDRHGVEARGIERVKEEDRTDQSPWDCFTFWAAANCTISTFSLGTLGASIWFMGLRDACLTILFFNLMATIPVAYFSVFGCRTGFRQMVFSRFAFGYWVAMFPGALNVIATVGWSTVNTIIGASVLRAVSQTHKLPSAAGIVIIALLTLIPSFCGYKIIHTYERFASIVPAIIFFILLGEGSPYFETGPWGGSGSVEAASVLSFGAAIVGFALGWSSIAADYTVNLKRDTPAWKIFWATYAGLNLPMILIECLGAAFMTTFTQKTTWEARYEADQIGGLIAAGLSPMKGFGGFLCVLMALSIVANNIPNIYSLSLTVQIFGPWAQAIPRLFLTVIGTGVYVALAIVGADHFESWLDTLLVILAYWLAIYTVIVLIEHLVFRKGDWNNYDFEAINHPSRLPVGIAAGLSIGIGAAGAVLGMAQLWYVGVIGRLIGLPQYGGDIGFLLSASFTAVAYPPLRYLEKRYFGR